MQIIGIDPSGNWSEKEKGKTGIAVWQDGEIVQTAVVDGAHFASKIYYWMDILHNLLIIKANAICCEDFLLYADKASAQTGSTMETPRLLGALEYCCYVRNIPFVTQSAGRTKPRWTNEILTNKEIIKPYGNTKSFQLVATNKRLCDHELDAIRQVMHGTMFNKKIQEVIKR